MEFLSENKFDTTTQAVLESNTDGARFLLDGNPNLQYITSGYDSTLTIITVSFTAATVINNVILKNNNFEEIYIYYDNTSTNCIYFTCSNTSKDIYTSFASQTVQSIQIVVINTTPPGQEKKLGELLIAERKLSFENAPSMRNFRHEIRRMEQVHEMPDGGEVFYNIRNNFMARIKWTFISETFKNDLKEIFQTALPITFVVNPTETSWDGHAYEVNWIGSFDFKPATNVDAPGYEGSMRLEQLSKSR